MLKKLKLISLSEEYKILLGNFFSLSVLQVLNYLLPLITLPYLIRVLGPEKYGLIAFGTAFLTYFQLFTDYGFNLSATKDISINRENNKKISEIFSSVIIIKTVLMLFSFIIIFFIVTSFSKFNSQKEVYYLISLSLIGNVLFPIWFFQGIERMKYITYFNVIARVTATLLVF